MSLKVLQRLALLGAALLLVWVIRLQRQIPRYQAPFAKATDFADQIIFEQASNRLELKRSAGQWKVSSAGGSFFPTDETKIRTLLSSLNSARLEDEISDRTDRAAEFAVDKASGTLVRLTDAKGKKLAEGIFGKQAPDYSHCYFRYPDRPNVYLAAGLIRTDLGTLEVNSWRSRQVISIAESQIQGIRIQGKGFETNLVRKSTDSWTLDGKDIDPTPVNALVGTLAHLRAEDFVDSVANPKITSESLQSSRVHVKGTNSEADLRIGAQDPKTKRYPATSGESGLVWIPEYSVNSLLQKPSAFKEKK